MYLFILFYSIFVVFIMKLDQITHGLKSVQLDDEDTSKTIDSGFEGEQQTKQNENFKSNNNYI